ncbi:MAG: DUF401 family protein [Pyrobaculum arsenaticum]|uniref:DUF401 family protein n=2 Tax=Pyrobaculum arsenaticum TaxID=121277 RepID=A4WKR7_PYRAR|nr:DUF401 family protein [Pyrobaculum arsenaticum]ABP50984.1 protein of unknown function DUF401 [Pyrobaculum arsenaticum DSM 13514]MCY0889622.1 DUF401 family protein [Pyrobaculum arsenaticum]NYR15292.1 DUF401 family protein [Pyrobaculum arsenaticum]
MTLVIFLISVLFIIAATLSRKLDVAYSLVIGALGYGFFALGVERFFYATLSAFNWPMAYVLASLVFAMALGFLLKEEGQQIASGLMSMGPRAAAFAIPAAIGLLPMPGGAYISAVVSDPLYNEMGLRSHEKTFINYFFRHIWIPVWPLFQGVLITAAVLSVSVWQVVEWSWPATLFAVVAGLVVALPLVKGVDSRGSARDLVVLWPLAAVAVLSYLIPLPLAVALVYATYIAVKKTPRALVASSLKYALNGRILAIIVFSLVFAKYIEMSGLSAELARLLGNYVALAVFAIPFAIGLATGVEFTFAALAFPPVAPFIHGPALALAFAGGFLGVMLSPAHSCLVLTREYYRSDIVLVYRLLAKASAVLMALAAAYYLLVFY